MMVVDVSPRHTAQDLLDRHGPGGAVEYACMCIGALLARRDFQQVRTWQRVRDTVDSLVPAPRRYRRH